MISYAIRLVVLLITPAIVVMITGLLSYKSGLSVWGIAISSSSLICLSLGFFLWDPKEKKSRLKREALIKAVVNASEHQRNLVVTQYYNEVDAYLIHNRNP